MNKKYTANRSNNIEQEIVAVSTTSATTTASVTTTASAAAVAAPAKRRIFIDMDGTLAEYRQVEDLVQLYQKNYFRTLAPNVQVCAAVRDMIEGKMGEDIEVFILSAYLVESPYALEEKNAWLDVFFGPDMIDAEHRIFVPCGASKAEYVPGGIRSTDMLLDDYTRNLNEWQAAGGQGLKLLNGINYSKGTWQQGRVSMRRSGDELGKIIYDTAMGLLIPFDKNFQALNSEMALPFSA